MAEQTEEQKAARLAADEAAKAAAKKAEKTKYEVLRPLNHDHKVYEVGKYVKLSDEEAEDHLMHRVIKLATKEVPLT